jgi:lipopolysaccharide/colanic/teichoic acid biosynthesis glycosyltransferase
MYKFLKRAIDVVVSATCLIFLSPLLFPIVVLLRCTADGEVFYLQRRL